MTTKALLAAFILGFALLLPFALGNAQSSRESRHSNDIAIGFDPKTSRPSLFIAWRNTQRILEVEIEVKNFGYEQATGQLRLEILDEEGNVLDYTPRGSQEPVLVTLPPANRGGREGRIVQMHGTAELNQLIDRLDRANQRYAVRAEVIPVGQDGDRLNNVALKTFNVNSRLRPSADHYFNYLIVNRDTRPTDVRWHVEHSAMPLDWALLTSIPDGAERRLAPGETVQGILHLRTPPSVTQGQHVDVRVRVENLADHTIVGMTEWYAVYDIIPPAITEAGIEYDPARGLISVHVTATDDDSMIREASGARVEYSTDGGITFSSRVLAYADGNFVGPTRFLADVGPFRPGTEVRMAVVVEDIAGNRSTRNFAPITLGNGRAPLTASQSSRL
jgi:hypothetical protein